MITKEQIYEYLNSDLDRVKSMLSSSLSSDVDLLNRTNGSILSHPGKMMRPVLTLLVARACSADGELTEDSYRCAVATELLHNATLLHDDVADNSDSRRGHPTVMKMLGPGLAVLLGDYWLVHAVENILSLEKHRDEAMSAFSKTLGDLAMGEMVQLEKAQDASLSDEDYFRIIYSKTASLFETAAVTGAYSVNASDVQIQAVRDYAVNLGLAFQIKDDIFDYQEGADIGKPVGHDILEHKITLPLLCALANADGDRRRAIRDMLLHIADNPAHVGAIVSFVASHRGIEGAEEKLGEYVAKAVAALEGLPQSPVRDMLESFAGYAAIRRN